jgi:hypothetical protein
VGRYTGKSNNKDQVDGVLVTFQSQADYEALKAKDRAAMLALGQLDQKKAAEALLSPKQCAVTFDTIPTPRTSSPALSASSRKPKLTVDTGPGLATKTPRTEKEVMAKSTAKSVANAQARSDKTVVTDTDLKLREALEMNANLTGMVEALMSKQKEMAAIGATVAKRKKSSSKAAKPHYYAVACGWHVGVFKVPTDLKEYQKATLDFPKRKLNTKRFATRKAASSWLQEELADSDEEQDFRRSDRSESDEERSIDSSSDEKHCPRRNHRDSHRDESPPDSSDESNSDEEEDSDSEDDSDDDQQELKRLRRRLTKAEIKSRRSHKHSKRTTTKRKSNKKPSRISDILSPEALGPDASVGKEDEIFGQSLEVQSEVLNFICPKGITLDVKEELMEAATDVCALPGKLKGNDASSTMAALGATLSDLNSRNARRKNTIPRETQWQNSNRNALGNIKTFKELVSCANELGAQRKQVIKNMHNRMTDTLFHAGWEVKEANLYYQAGLLPNIMRLTMDHYWELFTHLRSMASMQVDNWEAAKMHLQHHADKLRVIRDNASTRNQMLVQNYVYLRDAVASEFHSSDLTGKFMETM